MHCFPDLKIGEVNSLAITSDNKYIVSGSTKGIKVWDISMKKEIRFSLN